MVKQAAKKPEQKKAPKAKTAPAAAPAEKAKGELLAPQARILAALAKVKHPGAMGKEGIVAKANIHTNWVAEYIGGGEVLVSDRVRGALKLVPAGFVEVVLSPVDGGSPVRMYRIKPAGRKALEQWQKAQKS